MLMIYYITLVCYFCYAWKTHNVYTTKRKLLSKNAKMFHVYAYISQEIILTFEQ